MSKWEWKKLGEVCEIHGRIGWQGLTRKEYRSSGDYLLITGINFTDNNTVDYESCVYVDKERYVQDQYIQVRENDLLITKDGTLGKLALIAEMPPKPATLNGGLFVIRNPDNKIYPKFLMYVMKSEPFRKMIRKSITGSTVPHLTQNMLVNFPIPIPSLSEQRSIVKQLDEKLTKIEKIKTNAKTNLKNAKELFESTLEKELSLGKDGALPSGWEWKKLGEVCSVKCGATPLKSDKSFWERGTVPWFTVDDIHEQGRVINSTKKAVTEKALKKLTLFPKKTVLLCCTASVGEYAISNIEVTCNQQFNGLIVRDKNYLDPNYLFHFASTLKEKLLSVSGKTTIDFISNSKVCDIDIPLPPHSVQKEIVARLDKLSENVKHLEANYKQIITDCDELKKSILKKTFEGES